MPRSQKSRRLLLVKPAELLPLSTGADTLGSGQIFVQYATFLLTSNAA
jgi:hypothetical protein